MHKNFPITLNKEELQGDLVQLDISQFDVILGMDWLSRYEPKINYQKQRVSLIGKGEGKMYFWVNNSNRECSMISLMAARKLVRQGVRRTCAVSQWIRKSN